MSIIDLALFFAGLITLYGAGLNKDFFMKSRQVKFFSELLTPGGARAFYVILGVVLVTLSVLSANGVVEVFRGR